MVLVGQVSIAKTVVEGRLSELASACVHRRLEVPDELSRTFCEDSMATVR